MVNCRKILELYFDGISQRTISSSTGHSRNTVSDVVRRAKQHGLESLNDTTTNRWLEELLFPEKQASEKGYFPVEWEGVHKELQKRMSHWLYYIMNMRWRRVKVEKSLTLIGRSANSMENTRRNTN